MTNISYLLYKKKQICFYTVLHDTKYIYVSFDEIAAASDETRDPISNRIMSIDLNPNYIEWSVVDWTSETKFNVVKSGVYSLKHLNDIEYGYRKLKLSSSDPKRTYLSDKRSFETLQISKDLISKALHYKAECFAVEDLSIRSSDKGRGRSYNRLVNNNWTRNRLTSNLQKRYSIHRIRYQEIKAQYSSFVGNIVYRGLRLPDMVLASIEIGRRCYEFVSQYIKKTKEKTRNIIMPSKEFYRDLVGKSLEELSIRFEFDDLVELYYFLKKSEVKYRLSLDQLGLEFSSQRHLRYKTIYT